MTLVREMPVLAVARQLDIAPVAHRAPLRGPYAG